MVTTPLPVPATYSPACVVCGPTARCERAWIEGLVTRVERKVHNGPHGSFTGVHLHLQTADGPCLLLLAERFTYLADGLAEAPDGIAVRAYHLRRGRERNVTAGGDDGLQLQPTLFEDQTHSARTTRGALPRFLTDAESLVVLEPDWLVDVTALKGTDYCLRQWLANRLAAQPATVHMVRGTVVHGCFQILCREGTLPEEVARTLIARSTLELALLGSTPDEILEAVGPHLERLSGWRATFGADLFGDPEITPCYESTLLCPELGLRGRVDLALRRSGGGGPPQVSRVVELKTGKYNEEWPDPEFQVRGYYAILASQQRLAPDFRAQVIYTGSPTVAYRHVPCGPQHIHEVLTCRNRAVLALLIGHAPPPLGGNRCRKSSNRPDCVRLSTLLGLDHCRGRDLVDAAAGDEDPRDGEFYATQYRLLRLEALATSRELAALWRSTPAEREAAGTAITVLGEAEPPTQEDGRWRYRLRCRNRSELRTGETVLLSDGDPMRGDVTVATLLEAGAEMVEVAAQEPVTRPLLLDRYDNGDAQNRTLRGLHAWLCAGESVRDLLYGGRHPEIAPPRERDATATVEHENGHRAASAAGLNARQAEALDLALRTRDYLLVQGPPGTGKTFLIARMVRALVARGERVLLSAWTNQAIDTLLHAMREQGFHDFARLGSSRSMDPALLPYALVPEGDETHACTPEVVAERLRSMPVLAGTVSALADTRIGATTVRRDVLILDEAAQLGIAQAVGALRLVQRFILVGDDQQLPPVVQSEEAAHEGLSLSPFALLRPEAQAAGALVKLSEQYRMHAAIAAWPSEAFYDGALAAHPGVAARRLPEAVGPIGSAVTDREAPVVLVDAGPLSTREVHLAARAVEALVRSGVPAAQVGVVAPFRSTVAAVRRLLEAVPDLEGTVVDTVDRFQGAQREAMVVCLGLEGMARRGHAFVDDPRRLNVAFTRARAKLVVVGDLTRAGTLPTLAGFLHHCQEHGMPIMRVCRG